MGRDEDGQVRPRFGRRALQGIRAALSPRPPVENEPPAAGAVPDAGLEALRAADLAAAVPDPLVIFNRQGTILLANEAAGRTFGAAAGISLHLKFRAPEMHALVRRVVEEGERTATMDYAERVPFERLHRVTTTRLAEGLYALVFKDQSEALRIDRMRADFIANASHELRTPLATVSGFIETLRGPARDDAQVRERFLKVMQSQTERMARLIDDLLSLSRLEFKPYLKPSGRVDIAALAGEVADSMSRIAADAGVTIERAIPRRRVEVAGSRDELVQVLENLLENACKYGSAGGRVVLTVGEGKDGGATVAVRDFGPGIPEEHVPRLTERFYRVDAETSRARKGTGLGLAIVKHILSRHEGWLSIDSKLGEGSTFTAHFPPP